jgi:hypothetical protein
LKKGERPPDWIDTKPAYSVSKYFISYWKNTETHGNLFLDLVFVKFEYRRERNMKCHEITV